MSASMIWPLSILLSLFCLFQLHWFLGDLSSCPPQRYELETHLLHNLSPYLFFSSYLIRHLLREPPINRLSGYTTPFLHDLLNNHTSLCGDLVGVNSTTRLRLCKAERVSVLLTTITLVLSTESGTK